MQVTPGLIHDFKYYAEAATAAYCKTQQGATGGKISCLGSSYDSCPDVEKLDTKITKTWLL